MRGLCILPITVGVWPSSTAMFVLMVTAPSRSARYSVCLDAITIVPSGTLVSDTIATVPSPQLTSSAGLKSMCLAFRVRIQTDAGVYLPVYYNNIKIKNNQYSPEVMIAMYIHRQVKRDGYTIAIPVYYLSTAIGTSATPGGWLLLGLLSKIGFLPGGIVTS